MTRVLVVEDDARIAEALRLLLTRSGYDALVARSGPAGWQALASDEPDAVLLDLSLPGLDGIELLRRLRQAGRSIPVLAVTADGSTASLVRFLELGADDYVVKPYRGPEVIARLRAALRVRSLEPDPLAAPSTVLACGPLSLDLGRHEVRVATQRVGLSLTEVRLLRLFLEHPFQMLAADQIADRIWGPGAAVDRAALRVNIYRLRRKLDATGRPWGTIRTVSGLGWGLFEVDSRPDSG